MNYTRRSFLKTNLKAGTALGLTPWTGKLSPMEDFDFPVPKTLEDGFQVLDLSPAQWIWPKVGRTLPNTVVMFRRSFEAPKIPGIAVAHIHADSRYRLWVNGRKLLFGPAPHDPRYPEVDKIDLAPFLRKGENTIGVEVLYYGHGDGTWPTGVPGFIFRMADGHSFLCSDDQWACTITRAWPPGKFKRWFLRAFQEEFDARQYPYGWSHSNFDASHWAMAGIIPNSKPDEPLIKSKSLDYLTNSGGSKENLQLIERTIPLLKHGRRKVKKLTEAFELDWKVPAMDFFDFDLVESDCFGWVSLTPGSFGKEEGWQFTAKKGKSYALTFEFEEQHVGFPHFSIYAKEGTIVELLVHEAHGVNGSHRLLNTQFHSWTRFICKEGWNTFETFDYESLRWLQLHIHSTEGSLEIKDVGMLQRSYDFKAIPRVTTSDNRYNKVLEACCNTVFNQSQDLIVDGMARERQQYSNDVGHVIHALFLGFDAKELVARFCNTFSQGQTHTGFFLDCWPAFDRLTRIYQREIGVTQWGPLLDHGIGFNFDCYHYYMYSGDLVQLKYVYPRLKKFYHYLQDLIGGDGLVPVEDLGIPVVWIDHLGYEEQKHKQCAFNLYWATMLKTALAKLARAFEDNDFADMVAANAETLLRNIKRKYWSDSHRSFVCNLPWLEAEGKVRYDERSLSLAILFDLVPKGEQAQMAHILANRPQNMGRSFATNAIWRFWALTKSNKVDVILQEFVGEWYKMPSVLENNTMGEFFDLKYDDTSQWSHASISPLLCLYTSILGVRPLEPGCSKIRITPRLGMLKWVKADVETALGKIEFNLTNDGEGIKGTIILPNNMIAHYVDGMGKTREYQNIISL